MKTNLVIATWSGSRRVHSNHCFLQKQVLSLHKLKHNLDQITFVVPHNPDEPKVFRESIKSLPNKIGNAHVVILEKENIGLSYGSFSHAFSIYKEEFEYYIFLEDDYIFVEDNFDQTMICLFNNSENCGYLSTLAQNNHPSIFNGITKSSILSQIWKKYGKLPYSNCCTYTGAEHAGQIAYGTIIIELGYSLHDLSKFYKLLFLNHEGKFIFYGQNESKYFIVPAQYLAEAQHYNVLDTNNPYIF